MVDFKKRLGSKVDDRPTQPGEIYRRLDRESDKGPLRPAQEAVLNAWYDETRTRRDVVLKLHTGEGKTLIGLLILQSKLNELQGTGGRALYLCPNKFLVNQTLEQARQFGVPCIPADNDGSIPARFLDGKAILVAPVQKLFNGLTKFRLEPRSERVDALVVDDAHACIDAIRAACEIRLERQHPAYKELLTLFGQDLEDQGAGTYAEIVAGDGAGFLPVPYWAWMDRHTDVAALLVKHKGAKEIKFTWPLLRDALKDCLCLISSDELLIAPYRPQLERFGSFDKAQHRVFMSATISDDSFLIKGLGLDPKVVAEPLAYTGSAWSGEKMVLIPSAIDDELTSTEIVHRFAPPAPKRDFGVVALVPSFDSSKDWGAEGAVVATAEDIDEHIERLRTGDRKKTLVVVNRYDGIDLPDDTCRILILDGKPFSESLADRYSEECRRGSELIAVRTARVIEQGMGRAVRGEKDYCVVVLSGADLVRAIRTSEGRAHFAPQTRKQVEIGLTIAEYAREELIGSVGKKTAIEVLDGLVRQSLGRDEGWKDYYVEQMNKLAPTLAAPRLATLFASELEAERLYERGDVEGAVAKVQNLLDTKQVVDTGERGWYLQEMARYQYASARTESNKLQVAAHRQNRFLLKPTAGVAVSRLEPIAQARAERIIDWAQQHAGDGALMVAVDGIVGKLRFGVRAEPFERAMHELGSALGFASERPDKEWKAGPDNLWALRDGEYLLAECKSEVEVGRVEIAKKETGQMNNTCAWFKEHYAGATVTRVMVIPARKLANGAVFAEQVHLLRDDKLRGLARNVRGFFLELGKLDLKSVTELAVQQLLDRHHLAIKDLQTYYYEMPKARKAS